MTAEGATFAFVVLSELCTAAEPSPAVYDFKELHDARVLCLELNFFMSEMTFFNSSPFSVFFFVFSPSDLLIIHVRSNIHTLSFGSFTLIILVNKKKKGCIRFFQKFQNLKEIFVPGS